MTKSAALMLKEKPALPNQFQIHPSVGICRVGNSEEFYFAPDKIGGVPTENASSDVPGAPPSGAAPVTRYKDKHGRIKRQAARFKLFVTDHETHEEREVDFDKDGIDHVEWTVHLANKKPVWYTFHERYGDKTVPPGLMPVRVIPLRNANVVGETDRRSQLIIDFGPRTVAEPLKEASFDAGSPGTYGFVSAPSAMLAPKPIKTLGTITMDSDHNLVVLGGYGNACGAGDLSDFTGGSQWFDDISDGPVRCTIFLKNGHTLTETAWVVVGPPKFAPEIVNLVTLDDIMFDVGVRFKHLDPDRYDPSRFCGCGNWNPDYHVDYIQDIAPLIERPQRYNWVANAPYLMAFSAPGFNPADASEQNKEARQAYFNAFRKPEMFGDGSGEENIFCRDNGIPLMPMNAGDNAISNTLVYKYLSLTPTQYFHLRQWADGKFQPRAKPAPLVHAMDRSSVGNCVGGPLSPGVEISWSLRNPAIYDKAYRIKHRSPDGSRYEKHGLSTDVYDETTLVAGHDVGEGCEPGDLTKRMSSPWQSDFMDCGGQAVSFHKSDVNADTTGIPPAPASFAYWWPPQSPQMVYIGRTSPRQEAAAGLATGSSVVFTRGISGIVQMVIAWSYLGFIVNENKGAAGEMFPLFVETERDHDKFIIGSIAVADQFNVTNASDSNFAPFWFLKPQLEAGENLQPRMRKVLRHRRP